MAFQRIRVAALLLLVAVTLAYSNHFQNDFHFDDFHTVNNNPYIRSLRNAKLFFTDPSTFSILPANRTYRPLVTLSLAVDYWLGSGLKPFYFHLDTFLWYLVQLALMMALFRRILHFSGLPETAQTGGRTPPTNKAAVRVPEKLRRNRPQAGEAD